MSLNMKSFKTLMPVERMVRQSTYSQKCGLCEHCGHALKDHIPVDNSSFPKRIGPCYERKYSGCRLECIGCGCWALIQTYEED